MFRLFFILICCFSVIGSPARAENGSGPLTLSPYVFKGFQKYLDAYGALFFAVSEDGTRYGWSYCDNLPCGNNRHLAIRVCERYSRGIPCKIYAVQKNIVWNGPVKIASSESAARVQNVYINCKEKDGRLVSVPREACLRTGGVEVPPGVSGAGGTRPITIEWQGFDEPISGTATYVERDGRGTIQIDLPEKADRCKGEYYFSSQNEGFWWVTCRDGLIASGEFTTQGPGHGSRGSGTDSNEREVTFTIAATSE